MSQYLSLPNCLTFFRIFSVPFIFLLLHQSFLYEAVLLTALACLTDYFDGKLARSLNQVTVFGSILDPVADKIIIVGLFGVLYVKGIIPFWLFGLSTLRNFSQLLAIPVLMGWKKISFNVKPRFIPKLASTLSYIIILIGMLEPLLLSTRFLEQLVHGLLFMSGAVLSVLEIYIFLTYWPRFFQILARTHDTFE